MWEIITRHFDLWTSSLLANAGTGRGSSAKQEAYGIRKMRELILQLAVRGKLLPQRADDEPASELLRRAEAQRTQLSRNAAPRKEKDFRTISDDEVPFDLPAGWQWARIGSVGHDLGQKTPAGDFTYIDVSAIDNRLGIVAAPTVLNAAEAPSRARKIVKRGTVIYSTVRPYLKNICVIDNDFTPEPIASTAFAVLHPFQDMPGAFFALYFRSPDFVKYVESVQTGIAYPAINDRQFWGGLVPVPPLAEQHRIVARASELMSLCDRLEDQQRDSVETHKALVEALLGTLTCAASPQEISEAWSRIANHFDALFTTEHSVDQLRQAILQLAVTGKLALQHPDDEPAATLLDRVAERTATPERLDFPIPESWRWQALGDLLISGPTNGFSPPAVNFETGVRSLTLSATTSGKFRGEHSKFIAVDIPPDSDLWLRDGDILVQRGNTIEYVGVSAVFHGEPNKFIYPDLMMKLRVSPALNVDYIHLAMSHRSAREYLRGRATGTSGTMPKINQAALKSLPIPVPPRPEQDRIVARVAELTALCDALAVQLAKAQTTQVHLADAIIEQAVA